MTREELLKPSENVWLQVCPKCQQIWFIGEAQMGERYRCRTCQHEFVIAKSNQPSLEVAPQR